jgi:hypothetical protein
VDMCMRFTVDMHEVHHGHLHEVHHVVTLPLAAVSIVEQTM